MSEQPPSPQANLRDSLAAVREFMIVIAMLSLLFVPGRVKQILDDAGIRSLAGVEFDTETLAESEAEVEQARSHVHALLQQLQSAQQELAKATEAGGQFYDPGLDTALQHLANAQRTTIEAEMNLNRSHEKTMDILEKYGRTPSHDEDQVEAMADPDRQAALSSQPLDPQLQR